MGKGERRISEKKKEGIEELQVRRERLEELMRQEKSIKKVEQRKQGEALLQEELGNCRKQRKIKGEFRLKIAGEEKCPGGKEAADNNEHLRG
ncbi:hypothetical protein NPIL_415761 [Nephila pilipes]|uniref:Uncharacterized protein n=1 Tax=Nephila pilipes TaxID=299642 RepID=A0A8X6P315_NEPPI|nr:hypothetical protein NPIL_415761 [Nephila pilipes]